MLPPLSLGPTVGPTTGYASALVLLPGVTTGMSLVVVPTSVVTEPILAGQSVTVGAHEVMV